MDTRNPAAEHEALMEGQRAGHRGTAAGLNPHPLGSPEYSEWERGRRSIAVQQLARELRRRAAARPRTSPCRYTAELECNCGGRGLCLDVA